MAAFNIKSPWDEYPQDAFGTQVAPNTRTTTGQDAAFRQQQLSQTASPQANAARAKQGAFGATQTQDINQATPGWTSGLGPLGRRAAATDEGAFFRNLGTVGGGGFEPGGAVGGFLSDEFNPRFLAAAQNPYASGQGGYSYGEQIMQQSDIMGGLMGRGTELNPSAIVANTMQALMSVKSVEDLGKINPALAAILNAAANDPTAQVQALTNFLGQAMAGSMPADMLNSWMVTIERVAQGFMAKMEQMDLSGKTGAKAFDMASLAQYLTEALGPTLGI
jgi:hypothetical protein